MERHALSQSELVPEANRGLKHGIAPADGQREPRRTG
uniref:Uncharacterized protein n=1 Tax=Ralstonia solanacearum TaxID=305 RepID=A0A0S4VEU6_RALSL|nr:protein of unknown function [Ralstonia solanacearum]CUV21432.1 protein of unknown function [Ralstonia solanacearum]CUV32137.1 protein of unknown function [Ralstonia solanacearum]CUV32532.1 protein of unknown function [Ralstonia solanacearum]CUV42784.1 protein of unknown function [Ralstonia solanacearum]